MRGLSYKEMRTQRYLEDGSLSIESKRNIFAFRTHMTNFKENFKNANTDEVCSLCKSHIDSQKEAMKCPSLWAEDEPKGTYEDIFGEEIPKDIIETINKISRRRDALS